MLQQSPTKAFTPSATSGSGGGARPSGWSRTWDGLNELLERENVTLDEFCNHVEARKGDASFSSTMRSQILGYFRRRRGPGLTDLRSSADFSTG